MASSLPIGDFSRATHLSIKTLRHYHHVGLLEPADVDEFTGHRRYATHQIATAQVIRRFRELDMPIEDIKSVLTAPDVAARNELIAAHLSRLEEGLRRAGRPRDPARARRGRADPGVLPVQPH
jgi:DNA-binding transcriptional MerR regulator